MVRRFVGAVLGMLVLAGVSASPVNAHPMPDTEIVVDRDPASVRLTIRVPLADLLLALSNGPARDAGSLLGGDQARLRAYFTGHLHLTAPNNRAVPAVIDTIGLHQDHDADVGDYREVEVTVSARVPGDAPLRLDYDAVLHRIANHRAMVTKPDGAPIGVVRFSLAERRSTPVELPALSAAALNSSENEKGSSFPWGLLALGMIVIVLILGSRPKLARL